jgi:peptidoglycan/LPS O-acetylase OafA/YrhL
VSGSPNRIQYLDGLRGLAAVSVVLFHYLYWLFPAAVFGPGPGKLGSAELGWLHTSPLYAFISGSFAVALFFVLSGFVLGFPFCVKADRGTVLRAIYRRYPRLAIPILTTNFIYGLLLACKLISRSALNQIGNMTGTVDPASPFKEQLEWFALARYSLWDVFRSIHYDINPVLWTMHIEMVGSILVFGLLLIFGKRSLKANPSLKWWIYGLLSLLCLWRYPLFLAFLLGMLLCEAYVHNRLAWLRSIRVQIFLLIIAIYFAAIPTHPMKFYCQTASYGWVSNLFWLPVENRRWLLLIVAATCLIAVILNQPALQKLLCSKAGLFLGQISFSLYLSHFAVIYAVSTPLFIWLSGWHSGFMAACFSFALTFPICIGLAWLIYRWVDEPAMKLSRNMATAMDHLFRVSKRQSYQTSSQTTAVLEDKSPSIDPPA